MSYPNEVVKRAVTLANKANVTEFKFIEATNGGMHTIKVGENTLRFNNHKAVITGLSNSGWKKTYKSTFKMER